MAKLTLGTALPTNYVTRAQLIASLESLTPVDGQFCDGTTIVVTGGKVAVGTIPTSSVTGLVAALASKAPTNDFLEAIDALTTEAGIVRRLTAGTAEVIAPGLAVSDVVDAALPANGAIGALAVSNPPTQGEMQALRDATENVRDVVANIVITVEELRDRLKTTGGQKLIAD